MEYSFSIYEVAAFVELFNTELNDISPFNGLLDDVESNPKVIEQRILDAKNKIGKKGIGSNELKQLFDILGKPEKIYNFYSVKKSGFEIVNFFEANNKIISYISNDEKIYLDICPNKEKFLDFLIFQLGEISEKGKLKKLPLKIKDFLVLYVASSLSRSNSSNEIENLLGEASFPKEKLVKGLSKEKYYKKIFISQIWGIDPKLADFVRNSKEIDEVIDLMINKNILNQNETGLLTIQDDITEITNILSSPSLMTSLSSTSIDENFMNSITIFRSFDEAVIMQMNFPINEESFIHLGKYNKSQLKEYLHKALFQKIEVPSEIINPQEKKLIEQGLEFAVSQENNKAISCFHQALKINPKNATAWYNLGTSYINMGLFFDAKRSLNKAMELNPKSPIIWQNLGSAHYSLGEFEEAANCFVKVTKLSPENVDAWFSAGMAYGHLEDLRASSYLEKASRIDPDNPEIWLLLGLSYIMHFEQAKNKREKTKFNQSALKSFINADERGIKDRLSEEEYAQLKEKIRLLS